MNQESSQAPTTENENYFPRFICTKLKTLLKKNIVYLPKSRIPHTVHNVDVSVFRQVLLEINKVINLIGSFSDIQFSSPHLR